MDGVPQEPNESGFPGTALPLLTPEPFSYAPAYKGAISHNTCLRDQALLFNYGFTCTRLSDMFQIIEVLWSYFTLGWQHLTYTSDRLRGIFQL